MTDVALRALAEQKVLSSRQHFEVMDGLRGVTAMIIVSFHSFAGGGIGPNGPILVDLFFMLSGFVVAYSYDDRLAGGMTASDFIARRLIRLYPMVIVGALGGVLIALIHNHTNPGDAYPLGSIATSGALSLGVLPYLGHALNDKAFSFNPPLWSLFYELMANFVYVAFAWRFSNRVVMVVVILGLVAIGLGGPLGGQERAAFLLGVPRVTSGFFGGLLLCRLWRAGKLPRIQGNIFILSAITLGLFCIPRLIGGWAFLPVYAVFAAMMVCAAGARPSAADKYCALLGEISYPLYIIHWLTLYIFTGLGAKIGLIGPKYGIVAMAHWLCAPVIAYLLARYYETPARRLLTHLWRRRSVGVQATAARS